MYAWYEGEGPQLYCEEKLTLHLRNIWWLGRTCVVCGLPTWHYKHLTLTHRRLHTYSTYVQPLRPRVTHMYSKMENNSIWVSFQTEWHGEDIHIKGGLEGRALPKWWCARNHTTRNGITPVTWGRLKNEKLVATARLMKYFTGKCMFKHPRKTVETHYKEISYRDSLNTVNRFMWPS